MTILLYPEDLPSEILRVFRERQKTDVLHKHTYYMVSGMSILCKFPARDYSTAKRIAERIARQRCFINYTLLAECEP